MTNPGAKTERAKGVGVHDEGTGTHEGAPAPDAGIVAHADTGVRRESTGHLGKSRGAIVNTGNGSAAGQQKMTVRANVTRTANAALSVQDTTTRTRRQEPGSKTKGKGKRKNRPVVVRPMGRTPRTLWNHVIPHPPPVPRVYLDLLHPLTSNPLVQRLILLKWTNIFPQLTTLA